MKEAANVLHETNGFIGTAIAIRTWRQRLGVAADFPLYLPTDVERAMVAEIDELRVLLVASAAVAPARVSATTPAALAVLAERQRQQQAEGFTPAHDDTYRGEELRWAAVCYALYMKQHTAPSFWPWPLEWWKPRDRRANLVRAAALLIAEIERIDRAALAPSASLTAVDCPACNGNEPCDECHGQGKVIVSRADMAAAFTEHADSEGGHHD